MATKSKGPIPLSEAELIQEILDNRIDLGKYLRTEDSEKGLSEAQIKAFTKDVIAGLKTEVADCLQNGYKVTLNGLVIFTPKVKNGAKKGTKVRNPSDGSVKTLKADKPDEFKARARVSKSVSDGFPSLKSNAGQELHKRLYVKPKPAKKG